MTDPNRPDAPDDLDDLDGELLADLGAVAASGAPSAALKDRLMKSLDAEGRFTERFADRVAKLIDVTVEKARAMLEKIDDATAWHETALAGMSLYDIDAGPRLAGAVCGFVRLPAGTEFPEHTHEGDEDVLILQGGYVDSSGKEYRAGELHHMDKGSTHAFKVRDDGDVIYLATVIKGFTIAGLFFGPDDA